MKVTCLKWNRYCSKSYKKNRTWLFLQKQIQKSFQKSTYQIEVLNRWFSSLAAKKKKTKYGHAPLLESKLFRAANRNLSLIPFTFLSQESGTSFKTFFRFTIYLPSPKIFTKNFHVTLRNAFFLSLFFLQPRFIRTCLVIKGPLKDFYAFCEKVSSKKYRKILNELFL